MDLELRHLRVVCAIADTGSVTKPAAQLGLAQPALTAQLRRIEAALGGRLFERDRRGARPTPLGELVLARSRVLLPAVRGLQDEAARLANADRAGRGYRVGAVNGPILGGLVRRLVVAHPEANVVTNTSWSAQELAEQVQAGRLDFALIGVCGSAAPPAAPALTWHELADDAVFVLLGDWHPVASREEVALAELATERWVATPGDGCFAECFSAACTRAGFTPRPLYEMDLAGCVDMAQSGAAVALCQATFRPTPGLVTMPITGTPLRWRHLIGWDPQAPAAGFAGELVAHARAAHADAVRRNPRYAEANLPAPPARTGLTLAGGMT